MTGADLEAIKRTVRLRSGSRCADCNMTQADHFARYHCDLDVHRLVPNSQYSEDGCVAVCKSCHGKRREHLRCKRPLQSQAYRDRLVVAASLKCLSVNDYIRMVMTEHMDKEGIPRVEID